MRLIDVDALKTACNMGSDCKKCEREIIDCQTDFISRIKICSVLNEAPTIGGWISVKDRLPAETHSIFYPWFGKKQWNKAMWREQSDKVLVTVAFKDGTRIVTTGETHDGIWHTSISRILEPVVTHWMPLPEPKEED